MKMKEEKLKKKVFSLPGQRFEPPEEVSFCVFYHLVTLEHHPNRFYNSSKMTMFQYHVNY